MSPPTVSASADVEQLLVTGLVNLGLSPTEAGDRARQVAREAPAGAGVETLLRRALENRARSQAG